MSILGRGHHTKYKTHLLPLHSPHEPWDFGGSNLGFFFRLEAAPGVSCDRADRSEALQAWCIRHRQNGHKEEALGYVHGNQMAADKLGTRAS